MNTQNSLFHIAVALAIGILIGAERHWRAREAKPGTRVAGIRTFGLSGLLGGVSAMMAAPILKAANGAIGAALMIGLPFLAFSTALIAFGLRDANEEDTHSVTSTIAAMMAFVLGALAVIGDHAIAIAAAVAVTALLASREALHGFMRRLAWVELRAAVLVLVMTFLILPFAPDQLIGPWGGVNPRELWILAILMAVISFAGYVAVKTFGADCGLLIAGAVGGLSSSTAVTLAFARQARDAANDALLVRKLAAGALLAGATSATRAGIVALGLAPSLGLHVGIPLLALILVLSCGAWLLNVSVWKDKDADQGGRAATDLTNPFHLMEIFRFTLMLAAVFLAVRFMAQYGGSTGVLVAAGVTGIADVHAVAAAIPALIHAGLSVAIAGWAFLIGLTTSILTKIAMSMMGGGASFAGPFAIWSILALSAAICAAFAVGYVIPA